MTTLARIIVSAAAIGSLSATAARAQVAFDLERVQIADQLINDAIARKELPGAVLLVGHEPPVRQQVRKRAAVAHAAAGVRLPGEREGR